MGTNLGDLGSGAAAGSLVDAGSVTLIGSV